MKMRDLAIWGFLALALVTVFSVVNRPQTAVGAEPMSYSALMAEARDGGVKKVKITGDVARATMQDGKERTIMVPDQAGNFVNELEAAKVEIVAEPVARTPFLGALLANLLPLLIMVGLWFFLMRQMSGGGGKNGAMGFGKSKAKLLTENKNRVTFEASTKHAKNSKKSSIS
jgi:cell division protease FtsH